MVRDNDRDVINFLSTSNSNFSSNIDQSIFESSSQKEEIILCLNYDGMYGVNNVNRILQQQNKNIGQKVGLEYYKINDPIVFIDCPRFETLYNNLKGIIQDISYDSSEQKYIFKILVKEKLQNDNSDIINNKYKIIQSLDKNTIIELKVNEFMDNNDEDNGYDHIIPFTLAYAITIHKAQGLEYDSVKIIINSNIKEEINKNIFYTAITRAKNELKIYWSPETEKEVLLNISKDKSKADINILANKIKSTSYKIEK